MKNKKNHINLLTLSLLSSTLLLGSCVSDSKSEVAPPVSSSPTVPEEVLSSNTVGISVPSQVNTLPTESTEAVSVTTAAVLPQGAIEYLETTDYDKMGDIELKISEPALDQFSIIEMILKAFAQTSYADPRVVNKGPYKALVKWEEDEGGTSVETWYLNSKMIIVNGSDVNRVRFWIDEGDLIVKGIMDVKAAPTTANKYGVWRIDVQFINPINGVSQGSFVAESTFKSDGTVQLGVNQTGEYEMKGLLQLKNSIGKGVVQYPDWSSCQSYNCTPDSVTAKYAYDANHMQYQKGSNALKCKDRNSYSDIFMDYEIFDASGSNIKRSKTYSFPLKITVDGKEQYYYYGGWNGRQHLHGEDSENPLALGTILSHGEYGNDSSYAISKRTDGILVQKTKEVVTDLSTITGQVLEGQAGSGDWFVMKYDGVDWRRCAQNEIDWMNKSCGDTLGAIVAGGSIDGSGGKRVQMTEFGDNSWQNIDVAGLETAKLYNVYISQPLFVYYDGAAWKEKTGADFSTNPYEPTFTGEAAYSWSDGDFQHFWSKTGTSYIATVTGGGANLTLTQEIQTIIKPGVAVAGSFCEASWNGSCKDATRFVWDATEAALKNSTTQALLDRHIWDLVNTTDKSKYSYEYGNFAKMTFLTYDSNPPVNKSIGETVILDPSLRFDKVIGKDLAGNNVDVHGLSFDGYLFGYTNVWQLLHDSRKNDSEVGLSPEQKSKIVNFPAGTVITGDNGAVAYKIKPRRGMRLLDIVKTGCSASVDTSLTTAGVPTFGFPGVIGALPATAQLKVNEGIFLEDLD
ncbi:hypothetical protein A9Q84_14405 [Halobacteriovorax marinus]|uniref:Lipoprotein n=1 Tax=Halobacteriovorax marinus TaxID=97084 RepID=A0A1Y5F5B7_9BACT|nr:hypothetical protein A9Q84_14405 [Halobacteriovorax marinus]